MNNKQLGQLFSLIAGIATLLFGLVMLLPDPSLSKNLSYASSMFISIGYLGMACAFAVQVSADQKATAWLGMTLATAYFVFINLVYFTQLSTIRSGSAAAEVLQAITYSPGTWFFNLDLFGYGIMSLSTFCLGLSLKASSQAEKWLKGLMFAAGIFALSGILLPLFNLFSTESGAEGDFIGTLVLEFWCLYFIPVTLLAAAFFKKSTSTQSGTLEGNK